MPTEKTVLLTPPGSDVRPDPRYDEVRVTDEVESPVTIQELVPDDGETSVDRAFVNDERKTLVANAIADYEAEKAKDAPDVAVQLDALERAISYMWDVVSAEDVGSEAQREATKEDTTTDDSTSA
ncbi:hypothetical protein HRTV-14_gp33 [Halorubrum phage HRTV-14]|uniref:Uncharacterized protein n=1 Tax=Halorubrum phage HRTV-14 TaxID=2877994 RepID=A0AAE9BVD3_9CAUD|nr:hypothetical protein HRTV-14_gp33 [Halorubrum phage HRTV-14]